MSVVLEIHKLSVKLQKERRAREAKEPLRIIQRRCEYLCDQFHGGKISQEEWLGLERENWTRDYEKVA